MAEPSTSDAVVQEQQKSQDYEDLFPKLPGAAPTGISGMCLYSAVCLHFYIFCLHFFNSIANSAWQKPMKPIMTSSITSVFHIPVEERKDQVMMMISCLFTFWIPQFLLHYFSILRALGF